MCSAHSSGPIGAPLARECRGGAAFPIRTREKWQGAALACLHRIGTSRALEVRVAVGGRALRVGCCMRVCRSAGLRTGAEGGGKIAICNHRPAHRCSGVPSPRPPLVSVGIRVKGSQPGLVSLKSGLSGAASELRLTVGFRVGPTRMTALGSASSGRFGMIPARTQVGAARNQDGTACRHCDQF